MGVLLRGGAADWSNVEAVLWKRFLASSDAGWRFESHIRIVSHRCHVLVCSSL